jgi:hypothetical protein
VTIARLLQAEADDEEEHFRQIKDLAEDDSSPAAPS